MGARPGGRLAGPPMLHLALLVALAVAAGAALLVLLPLYGPRPGAAFGIRHRPAGIRLIDDILIGDKVLGLATQRDPDDDEPNQDQLYPTLCIGSVLKMLKFPDGSTRIVCQGLFRARLLEVIRAEPYLIGRI